MAKQVVKKLSKKEIKGFIEQGYVRVVVIFEMVGSPKEHIEKTMRLFLDTIGQDKGLMVLSQDIEETIEAGDGVFSTAAEVEYLVMGLEKLTWIAFNYMPASIEIKEPGELTFRDRDFSAWLNDLLARLHEVNMVHTALKNEHTELVKNLNLAIRNSVLLATTEPSSVKQIGAKAGISEKQVVLFVEKMVQEGKLAKKGEKFVRA